MQTAQQKTFDFLEAANDNSNEDAAMKAFNQYHKDNPHVYDLVVQYAKQAIDAGYDHYSIVTIANRIRWHTEIETRGDRFKINNNHLSRYARKFHDGYPQHAGFFRTRVIKGVYA